MKIILYILSVFLLVTSSSSNLYAKNWLKIANKGIKAYEQEDYCGAFNLLNEVKLSESEDANVAIQIIGSDFEKKHAISKIICQSNSIIKFEKKVIAYYSSSKYTKSEIIADLNDLQGKRFLDRKSIKFYKNNLKNNQNTMNSGKEELYLNYKNKYFIFLSISIFLVMILAYLFYSALSNKK